MVKNRLHKYVSIDALKRILGGSIRMTQPCAFNDPFELLPELIVPADQAGKPITFSFDVRAPRREDKLTTAVQLADGQVASDITSRHILDVLNQQIGILCLSEAPNSILMWSHYADQYQGAVISFDADHEFFAGQIEVEYVEERPKKHIDTYKPEPVPLAELCAKSVEWRYEQEVRIVRSLQDCKKTETTDNRGFPVFTADIPQEAIVSVALGERTPIPQQQEIYQLVKSTKIGLTLSAVDNAGYGFRQEVILYSGDLRNPSLSPRTAHIFLGTGGVLAELARTMIDNHPISPIVNKTV
ncbi:DUF2971 domain-containing protein [Paraburkholderia phenoliruptrix]|uniref:DUF2971 domain-containing protein n=1 Tax=Paraburkholderia phenoliruptrix TaxID=252970 RepID=UPI00286982BB|nr:DUF2971 domain-containing protein [Paraburkholderia phenoliruptrix]WMY09102.1 DUF2971 domain-containing protein [Paraburkholderia phenoliruptrix]